VAALIVALAAAGLPSPVATADPVNAWAPQVAEAARRFQMPAQWIRRVMRVESGGKASMNGRQVVSSAGAMGLMQLMPGTWREMRARLGLGPDPFDPLDNILAGAAYLRLMYDRFGYPGMFAAYNAGPARYAAFVRRARPLPAETRAYVAAMASLEWQRSARPRSPAALFALGSGERPRAPLTTAVSRRPGLFVPLAGEACAIGHCGVEGGRGGNGLQEKQDGSQTVAQPR